MAPRTHEIPAARAERDDLVRHHLHAAARAGQNQTRFAGAGRAENDGARPLLGQGTGVQDLKTAPGEAERDREIDHLRGEHGGWTEARDRDGAARANLEEGPVLPEKTSPTTLPSPPDALPPHGLPQKSEVVRWRE